MGNFWVICEVPFIFCDIRISRYSWVLNDLKLVDKNTCFLSSTFVPWGGNVLA